MNARIFSGVYPAGIVYADREREEGGDYKRLAFLPFSTLALDVRRGIPADLRAEIEADAATIIARAGEPYQISTSGQTVTLGGTRKPQVNCDGSGPHDPGEVRVLPTSPGSNAFLCRACYRSELSWRRERNRTLGDFAQFDLPQWEDLAAYNA